MKKLRPNSFWNQSRSYCRWRNRFLLQVVVLHTTHCQLTYQEWMPAPQKHRRERAINGTIVCVLRRTRALGTHSFVCLLAVTQPASTPFNKKDTMNFKSLSIHIFRIITRINFDLFSYSENKTPWLNVSLGFGFLNCTLRLDHFSNL